MLTVVEEEDVVSLIDRSEAIGLITEAYKAVAVGQAAVSQPASMDLRGRSGSGLTFKIKGAVLDATGVAGVRLRAPGSAYVYVIDAATGQARGLVAELWLYRLRTAITAIVACKTLMPEGASRIALIGTGRIAEQFVRSCHLSFPGVPIVIGSRSFDRARAKADDWRCLTSNRLDAAPISDAVAAADIVLTLSDANERLFDASLLKPRTLICGMGGNHEFDSDVLAAASGVVVDELQFVCAAGNGGHWIRSGQIRQADLAARVDATIGEVLLGSNKIDRSGRVLALIQGTAVCDLALASLVLDRARKRSG